MPTKPITIAPLSGVLDLRSTPDLIPQGGVRFRQNLQTIGEGKVRRGHGWSKLLTEAAYNNPDFHDQLLTFGATIRQPVTLIHEAQSSAGVRSLFIANQGRILRLSEHGGNYKVLGSGFGGTASASATAPRFRAARVGDYLAFTNDWDKPKYHILEQVGESGESLYDLEDLDTISLRRAKFVWSWRNFLIFANVEMEGQRFAYRLLGSDFENPTSFDPAKVDSVTWQKDLMSHEEILGGAPSGNEFLIYTTHGIWAMSIVGGEQVVGFRRAYNGEDNDMKGLLRYPNLLVNLGDVHLFGGHDGLYLYNQFYSRPDRPEWLHRATSLIYDQLDESACEAHVAGIQGDEVLVSVAETGQSNQCPNVTLRINMAYKACDKVDFGFTAVGRFITQDVQTVRDFIVENGICTMSGMIDVFEDDLGFHPYENEGLPNPLPVEPEEEVTCIHTLTVLHMGGVVTATGSGITEVNTDFTWNPARARYETADKFYHLETTSNGTTRTWKVVATSGGTVMYSHTSLAGAWGTVVSGVAPAPTFALGAGVILAEDYEKTASDGDSLCTLLGSEVVDAGCRGCPSQSLFVGASSEDLCLKQLGGVFYREECTNPTAVGTTIDEGYQSADGSYLLNGYDSIWIPGPLFAEEGGVYAQSLTLQYQARAQTPPSAIGLRVGVSGQVADPNTGACMVWHQRSQKNLKCQSDKTQAQHLAANTKPTGPLSWNFEHKAQVLYFELKVSGTGGDVDFSSVKADVKRYEMRRH